MGSMTGSEYRRMRLHRGLTQADLADLIGVSANTIARRERGERAISAESALLIKLLFLSTPPKGKPTPGDQGE